MGGFWLRRTPGARTAAARELVPLKRVSLPQAPIEAGGILEGDLLFRRNPLPPCSPEA